MVISNTDIQGPPQRPPTPRIHIAILTSHFAMPPISPATESAAIGLSESRDDNSLTAPLYLAYTPRLIRPPALPRYKKGLA
ncbi:hypothetical protein BHE90_008835 [Fusarium euwallaceae]|uniref:Uncharacterized protein n=4 Tax=Fusarium solani species complex TaxID=232080 RepID=A0A428TAN0_9HYPO|nr:hypothetical protein CEP51_010346 [Fusarium floridanum]RSL99090.1 hypothetical protein CEP52_009918 [Fusarium oligoseptatum]RSM17373.1 hypothetical protein CDV31_003789 [Fusarium ambrosium]RTE76690.1 hypothetical protein BHE90_008835 [Fusarium euwallaceae]